MSDVVSRRDFVEQLSVLGATWALALSPAAVAGGDPHQHGAATQGGPRFFTAAEAREMAAITERVIPSDDGPGAREAAAIGFIDRGLATFAKDQQKVFRDGLADLSRRVAEKYPSSARFSAMAPADQDAVLKEIEQTPFFQAARFATIAGMLALPSYGGNRAYIGWKAIGLRDAPTYSAPFGYYDRPDVRRKMLGGEG